MLYDEGCLIQYIQAAVAMFGVLICQLLSKLFRRTGCHGTCLHTSVLTLELRNLVAQVIHLKEQLDAAIVTFAANKKAQKLAKSQVVPLGLWSIPIACYQRLLQGGMLIIYLYSASNLGFLRLY